MSSDRLNAPSFDTTTSGPGSLVEARFVPQRYEPNYPYPLLVLFHARGGDEQQMVRSMPALSWRNYVGLSLRGPEAVDPAGPARRLRLGPGLRPARPPGAAARADALRGRDRPPPAPGRRARPDRRCSRTASSRRSARPAGRCTSTPSGSSSSASARGRRSPTGSA